jgi:uracil phosphoribosyltransferase
MDIVNLSEKNSLVQQFLTEIRDVSVQKDRIRFRRNMERIGEILAYEISKELDYKNVETQTPLAKTTTTKLSTKIVLGTILRAGIPFHQGFLNYFDHAENFFISAFRKHTSETEFDIQLDYVSGPELTGKTLIIVDPMLATALSMEKAILEVVKSHGMPEKINIVATIATKNGVEYLKDKMSGFPCKLWTAAIDPEMNEKSYIVPGLGDAGDLAYGEKI